MNIGFRYLLMFISVVGFNIEAATSYTIARAPQSSITRTEEDWTPFIEYMNKKSGFEYKLKLYSSRSKFEREIKEGAVDFYFANPGYGVVGYLNHGYEPILRSDKKKLQGIVVVRRDSVIKNIENLTDKVVVFPGKNAFAASLLVSDSIFKEYKISLNSAYVHGHDNVYRNVLNGNYVAGGGVHKTLNREPVALKKQLRIIYETPAVASHPLMVKPSVPAEVMNGLIDIVMELTKTADGREILKRIKLSKPVLTDYKKEYQPLESLVKKLYKNLLN